MTDETRRSRAGAPGDTGRRRDTDTDLPYLPSASSPGTLNSIARCDNRAYPVDRFADSGISKPYAPADPDQDAEAGDDTDANHHPDLLLQRTGDFRGRYLPVVDPDADRDPVADRHPDPPDPALPDDPARYYLAAVLL
jgi:hypothetical protein